MRSGDFLYHTYELEFCTLETHTSVSIHMYGYGYVSYVSYVSYRTPYGSTDR